MATIRYLPPDDFIGVPVLLQLKRPFMITQVTEARALSHANQKERQWIPVEARAEDAQSLAASEFIRYAVIKEFSGTWVVVQWVAPGLKGEVIVESIIPAEDIAGITRIVGAPPLPEEAKLVTL